jgi:hypothetical protein
LPFRPNNKPKAKAIPVNDIRRNRWPPPGFRTRKADSLDSIDWLALWALSIGLSAIFIAALAFFRANDPRGASYVLFGAAAIIALVLATTSAADRSG